VPQTMSDHADSRRAAADRVLRMRARRDLQSQEVALGGRATFVVTDPVSGESFHLSAQEHRLLESLREPTSLRDLQRIVEQEFAPERVSLAALDQFVRRMYEQGLLASDVAGQGAELFDRGQRRRRRSRRTRLLQVLAIRLGSFPAASLVDRLYAAGRWVFSPLALVAAAALVLYAGGVAIAQAPTIAARLPALEELARPSRLPLWLAAIAGVKILHELGHALTARHFGARPQEMGVLLLAGAPALYCDVSDAWRLPSRWQRMAVSSAGMAVELVIAAMALLVWQHATPSPLSTLCLSLVIVCSVGTLVVNANPLLRYDGYYLLSDWLETPNLAGRARGYVAAAWRRWLLGEPPQEDPLVGPGKRRALWIYAIASKVYLALVLGGVFVLALRFARPHGLQNAVYALAGLTIAGLLLQPATALATMAANPSLRARLRRGRLAGSLAVLAALAAAAWWWPMTRRVEAPLVAVPEAMHPLFAVTGGALEFAVAEGVEIDAGDVIARLKNPEAELALAQREGEVAERRVRLEHLRTLQAELPTAARMIPTAAAELADAEAVLAEQRAIVESLVVRAPAAGRVLAPPSRPRESRGDALPSWSGSPLDARNRGAWIEVGTPLAVIAAPGGWVAWAGVDQADVPAVDEGHGVRMVMDEMPSVVLAGRVTHISRRARENQTDAPRRGNESVAVGEDDRYHVVEISIDARDASLLAGARGVAKIATYESTLGRIVWHELRQAFSRVF
jgi:putative peptide zinc metalloprotease protein